MEITSDCCVDLRNGSSLLTKRFKKNIKKWSCCTGHRGVFLPGQMGGHRIENQFRYCLPFFFTLKVFQGMICCFDFECACLEVILAAINVKSLHYFPWLQTKNVPTRFPAFELSVGGDFARIKMLRKQNWKGPIICPNYALRELLLAKTRSFFLKLLWFSHNLALNLTKISKDKEGAAEAK